MRVLVTGCHGFLGHHVARRLLALGHEVFGIDRIRGAMSPKRERVEEIEGRGLRFVEADLCEFERVREIVRAYRFDAIAHMAAQFAIGHRTEYIERYIGGNVRAFLNVMEAALLAGVPRVVYASSIESSPAGKPSSLYGATKGFNEHAAHVYSLRGVVTIGLRYGIVYGPLMRMDTATRRVIRCLAERREMKMASGFHSRKPYVYIDDAAEFTARCLSAPMPNPHVVMLLAADDFTANLGDVIDLAAPVLGVAPRYPFGFAPSPRQVKPDLAALALAVGELPKINLESGVPLLARWIAGAA